MSFWAIPEVGTARSVLFVRVAGDWVESGGSAQASRKRDANEAKTSHVSTIRMLLIPAPISGSPDSFEDLDACGFRASRFTGATAAAMVGLKFT